MADWADNYHEYLYQGVEEVVVDVEIPIPLQYVELQLVLEEGGDEVQPSGGVFGNEGEGTQRTGRTRDLLPSAPT